MDLKMNVKNSEKDGKKYNISMDNEQFHKMVFLYNAVNKGWSVKKLNDSYIFKKNHEGKKEVFHESYLHNFMRENMDMNELLS